MIGWRPKDNIGNRKKANKVARYYYAYFNFTNHRPSYQAIAAHFGRSVTWAGFYLRLARDLGFIRNEWTVQIERTTTVSNTAIP